jgi:hypothetical protein
MVKLRDILQQRFSSKEATESTKAVSLAERSSAGQLSSFGGLFGTAEPSAAQRQELEDLLRKYAQEDQAIDADLSLLTSITGEIKAISNQAAFLHGERIKRAQELLLKYRDGAFTAWLLAAYGNRQTPYNFLQYFEFCLAMPRPLRQQIDQMPRQAIYALASREGQLERKEELVRSYAGQTKEQLLQSIRELFPLAPDDRRQEDLGRKSARTLSQINHLLISRKPTISREQRSELLRLCDQLRATIEQF